MESVLAPELSVDAPLPADVSIAGFDAQDVALTAEFPASTPQLTSPFPALAAVSLI